LVIPNRKPLLSGSLQKLGGAEESSAGADVAAAGWFATRAERHAEAYRGKTNDDHVNVYQSG